MKLALGYSTKDQVELTKQTLPILLEDSRIELYWAEGSLTEEGQKLPSRFLFRSKNPNSCEITSRVRGGADAAIAWKLTRLLKTDAGYLGLIENDVMLDPDWFEPTMELFEKGRADGLDVGAVSPRSYVDRVLIQRGGYAVMHNIGAGAIIFTRAAAEIVLRSFRTQWWPDNVRLFAQLAGIDLRTYACFRGQEQFVTTDWGFEAQLARHGLASLALTPSKAQMIGQVPSLKDQGLELTTLHSDPDLITAQQCTFENYAAVLDNIRKGYYVPEAPGMIHRDGASMLFFPHQLGAINALFEKDWWKLKWSQGFGPFAYQARAGIAAMSVSVSGPVSFLVTGGDTGSSVTIEDARSGFKFAPDLPPAGNNPISITVPGGPIPRLITAEFAEGAVFYGLSCEQPQMIDTTFKFDWSQLPEAE